ncbi:protein of unknown function DUF86 [Rippkaea orientalis PCC 8801]|uniref:TPR repeat-containing protein n=1 Tax=Rippkaea orientalis (strain PCC 8801 / RF-1) TaxID=41431 RepID=B7JXT1_RIPO1|nr:HepT-like ribonuclease domain-containing protein [Rippkaea orientalis]ACK65895.1 protein of unknown function DUF86 [Rippkaea orientalis PCC 8801]
MSSRGYIERIKDILEAIKSIQNRTKNLNFNSFKTNETIIKAVLYDLIIIGEAATNISDETKQLSPKIPWQLMSDMRNLLAHEYLRVDVQIVWDTIDNNLTELIEPLENLLEARQLGYTKAIASYDKALEINPNDANTYYNKACTYSLQNNLELAIQNLQQAINLDEQYREMAKTDQDFDNIRDHEQFQNLVKLSKHDTKSGLENRVRD